ncbi:MAG: hybrid sensor histidine kinase/response regulator [Gammaproteobacteria bacterium]|nr:hybrid sensor histidine kinase/response regulator [Gammaproteobacteria bacterium]
MPDDRNPQERIAELTARLEEAEETLRAVRAGEIDAFIVQGPDGEQVFTLRSAEQPYRNLVEEMQEGAAILTAAGDIMYCNRQFSTLLGVPLEHVIGCSLDRFISSSDRRAFTALVKAGVGKRRARLISASGRIIEVYLSLSTSTSEDDAERLNLLVTDLSALLDAQSGRDRAEQENQAKDEFMAMLAHELRNPLSAISAAVEVLEASNGQEKPALRARSIIARQVHHLARLVDDLLDVGRVVTGKIVLDRRPIDFADLVHRAVAVCGERQPDQRLEVMAQPVWIEGDLVRMEQIVNNIVGNAVKYTPSGGTIRVKLAIDGADAVLRVEDDGYGIAPELLPRVFDLFVQGEQTLDRAQGGLGIGLTLVRRLVELHRGTVSAFSEGPGRGSVFTVRLPKVSVPRSVQPSLTTAHCDMVARRILVIEDNRDAREMFKVMLELAGHEVLEAEEGLSGLELLKAARPDIAVIDVGLPGLNGYEIARRFRTECGGDGVMLVALTGYGTPEARERSRQAGFDHHLIKPVNPDTLRELLRPSDVVVR